MATKPLRVETNRGADEPLARMLVERPNQPHIRTISPGHFWVDLPGDVFVSVELGKTQSGRSLPDYTVATWRNAYDRSRGGW